MKLIAGHLRKAEIKLKRIPILLGIANRQFKRLEAPTDEDREELRVKILRIKKLEKAIQDRMAGYASRIALHNERKKENDRTGEFYSKKWLLP